ncbi:TPA: hypothetical protein ACF24Z_004969 [Klebsiella pneumoniae]|uniref:hypothetical protein n=1 Tax=Klebsiella pneumoniae TaxID=573 RepID=UPI0020CF61F8|nr:hypothetical protein [Klebsiella pneumoniae]MCQ0875841.1 hypothetical protein [Klebsiella pneumoniae]
MKTIVLVLLYNKSIDKSETLISLKNNKYTNYDLIIYNNGPDLIGGDPLFNELNVKLSCVDLYQDISNKPLSIVYNNFFSSSKGYERFIIFDDDTIIPANFFSEIDRGLNNSDIDLQLPLIKSRLTGQIFYPAANDKVIFSERSFENNEFVLSIGSGLIIYSKLVNLFNKYNLTLFDDRFALYGVDFSLFRRMQKLKDKGEVINIQCNSFLWHSLSRVDSNDSLWRQNERLIDTVLSILFYSPFYKKIYSISKLLFINALRLNINNIKIIINVLVRKRHPRCN